MTEWGEMFQVDKILAYLLIFFRIGGIFLSAPLFGNRSVPPQVKIAFSLMIAIVIFPSISTNLPAGAISSDLILIKLIAQELTIGILIGLITAMLFATIQVAGEIIGVKVGFSIATVIDPSNQGASNILASMYVIFGSLIFLFMDGHHIIIGSLIQSFEIIPLGAEYNLLAGFALVDVLTGLFILAIKISAPVVIVLTMLNIVFGFITKLSPQMNVYFNVGFILGPVLGIVVLLATLPLFRMMISGLTVDMGPEVLRIVHQLKGS